MNRIEGTTPERPEPDDLRIGDEVAFVPGGGFYQAGTYTAVVTHPAVSLGEFLKALEAAHPGYSSTSFLLSLSPGSDEDVRPVLRFVYKGVSFEWPVQRGLFAVVRRPTGN